MSNRVRIIVGAVAALFTALTTGPAGAQPAGPDEPLSVEIGSARLAEVMAFLEQVSDAPFEVMWLDDHYDAGLDPDRQVSLTATDSSVRGLLERVLRQAGPEYDRPTWQIAPDRTAIQIGPRSRLNDFTRIEVYDLRDLLFITPTFDAAPKIDFDAALSQTGGSAGNIFQDADDAEAEIRRPEEIAGEIMDLIRDLIEPDQWLSNGGDAAQMRLIDRSLIIRAPGYVHRQIEALAARSPID